MPDEPVLTYQTLVDLWELLDPKTIYYYDEPYVPKVDEEGVEVFYRVPMLEQEVWLLHPDNVPLFLDAVKQTGRNPIKFDFEKVGRHIKPKWEELWVTQESTRFL